MLCDQEIQDKTAELHTAHAKVDTSGQSNLTKGRIAAPQERFSRIRQV